MRRELERVLSVTAPRGEVVDRESPAAEQRFTVDQTRMPSD